MPMFKTITQVHLFKLRSPCLSYNKPSIGVMEATQCLRSSFASLPERPFSSKVGGGGLRRPQPKLRRGRVFAAAGKGAHEWNTYGGRLVDESMIQLRKRIHEMKMLEANYEPPSDWADWEKRYYTSYEAGVCQAVGLLQAFLMSARPSQTIGVAAVVALSVPTSILLLAFHLVESANGVLSGFHF